jgi:pimeloyl-ACP methyl ester carboxylesterase
MATKLYLFAGNNLFVFLSVFLFSFASVSAQMLVLGESATIQTSTGTLSGTLLVPPNLSSASPAVVVLIISGSGPTDRDGNSTMLPGKNNSLKLVAEEFAQNGVASLRYDKRGIGASKNAGLKEEDLRFETYVQDAEDCITQLRADKRFQRIIVLGHSEGSLIGMIAAQKQFVNGFISVAGAGLPAAEIIKKQIAEQPIPDGFKQQIFAKLDSLNNGQTVRDVPPMLYSLFRPSVQPYMMSWMRYNPQTEIAKFLMPSLIVQGTTDMQVSVSDAELLAKAQPAARVAMIENMNHVLKITAEKNLPKQMQTSYQDPVLPLAPEFAKAVVEFVKGFR